MRKRVMTSIMAIVLAISLTVPAFATTYTDLTNHWAKTYMEALASAGYMNGYTDGTMKPDRNMTTCETLTLLSRLYTLDTLQSKMIADDYETIAKANMPTSVSWAYGYIEVCLAAGIITESELKSIDLTANIKKEQLAVFLVRAVQLTSAAENLKDSTLTFADASTISEDCVGSVAELLTLGIVKGDTANNFSPKTNVTRAVVATMVARTLDYLETKGTALSIAAYAGLAQQNGVIASVSGSTIYLRAVDGLTRAYTVASGAKVTVNGVAKTLGVVTANSYALVTTQNGVITNLAITSSTSAVWVQGILNSVSTATSYGMIYLTQYGTTQSASYSVSSTATITRNGATAVFSALTSTDFVTVKVENSIVTEIYAATGDVSIAGTVTSINYGTTVSYTVTDINGTIYCFSSAIASLPTITRGTSTITFDRLNIGSKVTVTIDNCVVTIIKIEGTATTAAGELTKITSSSSGTVWTIKGSTGAETTYTLDDDAAVYSGTTEIALSDVKIGDSVTLEVYDSVITAVHVQSIVSSSTKITGKVLSIDTSKYQLLILTTEEKLVYISLSSTATIINAKTGQSIYYTNIPVDSGLVAYGSYTDTRTFAAKSIIIE